MLDYETVLANASHLPTSARIQLIEALWDTLPSDSVAPLSEEWRSEIQRRSAQLDSGSVSTTPWEQIREDALHRIGASDAAH
jgi:putative addiction module component (TIGR02574 family)